MHWSTQYIGLPYLAGGRDRVGLDCWGLIRLIYHEHLGVLLPELPGIVPPDLQPISRENLAICYKGWVEVGKPKEWVAVGMSRKETVHHVGVWTEADGGRVIHCWHELPVVADTPKTLKLRGLHIRKFYVWPS